MSATHVWADDIRPEYVTIQLSGAEIARLPNGPAKKYMLTRLGQQLNRVRRATLADAEREQQEAAIRAEMDRLEAAAQNRYEALAAQGHRNLRPLEATA